MAISFVAATSHANTNTAATVSIPAACQQNDLIIVLLWTDSANVISVPAGYTQFKTTLAPVAGTSALVFYKLAGASDGGTTLSVAQGSSSKFAMSVAVYRGCDQTTPIDTAVGHGDFIAGGASGTTHDTPAATVSNVNSWAVWLVGDRGSPGSTSFSVATGAIETQSNGPGGGGSMSLGMADSAGVVSTGTLAANTWTGTISTNNDCTATLILIPAVTVTTLAVTSVYGQFSKELLDAFIAGGGVAGAPTIRLLDSSYVFDQDAHVVWSDVSAHEVGAGNGYPTGGNAITASTSYDSTTHRCKMTSAQSTFTGANSGFATSGAVIVFNTGTAGTTLLGAFLDFGGTVSVAAAAQLILQADPTLGWLFGGLLAAT